MTDRPPRRLADSAARVLILATLLGIDALVATNLLINLALPLALNRQPDRFFIDWTVAWMVVPGTVHVRGLEIRAGSPTETWWIHADGASGVIALPPMLDREFRASALRADGVTLRYDRHPKDREPGDPWRIRLDDLHATHVRELWVGDYRLTGDATVDVDVGVARPILDLDARVSFGGMHAHLGDIPFATDLRGEAWLLIDALDRDAGDGANVVSGEARLAADLDDLRFLDFGFADVPWLGLDGRGHARIDAAVDAGQLRPGSMVAADFPELTVRLLTNTMAGTGKIRGDVIVGDDGPQSRLGIEFAEFTITTEGATTPLVDGIGLRVQAVSPDTAIDRPMTAVDVVFDLPESRITDVRPYNAFLPSDVGIAVHSGSGEIHGQLRASGTDNRASGDLYLTGDDLVGTFDAIEVTGDLALHAKLADARLDESWYDVSGTSLKLRNVGIVDADDLVRSDGERSWAATVRVPSGVVRPGAPVYLDAELEFASTNSIPFVRIFADQQAIPGWSQGLLNVADVRGEARVRLGTDMFEVGPCSIRCDGCEIDLRLRRDPGGPRGSLYARYGLVTFGLALDENGSHLRLLGAKSWYEAQPDPYRRPVAEN